jgi:hypothetical protein
MKIMKKILIMMLMAVAATNINAQLVVDSLGRVGIGTETPKSLLSVGGNSTINSIIYSKSTDMSYGLYVSNVSANYGTTYSGYFRTENMIGNGYAIKGQAIGLGNTSQSIIGIGGNAGFSHTGVGVFGGLYLYSDNPVNFAGVYGSESGSSPSFTNYSGTYAGFFKGKVRVTNGIYATLLSPSASPSPSGQGGTTILSDRGESVTDKLSQVQAVQFLRYDPAKETNTAKTNFDDLDIDNMSPEELDSLSEAMGDIEPEPYLSPVQYGLDANQLKAVYPELVYEDDNGNVSINYVEMVPLLVQSIKELSAKVEMLEQQVGAQKHAKKAIQQTTALEKTKGIKADEDSSTYDLSGRRAVNPRHGVYVQDGKKIAFK